MAYNNTNLITLNDFSFFRTKKKYKKRKNNMNFAFAIAMIWLVGHAERSNIKMKRTLWNTHSFFFIMNIFAQVLV